MGQLDLTRKPGCELCVTDGGFLVVRNVKLRVIRVLDVDYPGFYRVIWNDHAAEFTDLATADRVYLMDVLSKVESLVRTHLQPTKVNLASLGNVVPHLHWHVIARFEWDARWPAPVWAPAQRAVSSAEARLARPLSEVDALIAASLSGPAS